MKKYDIFISYRRNGGEFLAGYLNQELKSLGYSVFYDIEEMHAGTFNNQLLDAIEMCEDVLVILPENALDRCENEGDWLRQEIAHSIRHKKNIIPIIMRGFNFPDKLPPDIDSIRTYHGVDVIAEYLDAALVRIENLLTAKKE